MAAGLGFKTFVTGEVLTAADTNGYLMQGVNVFANAAARTAAITSPQEGQYSYLKDTDSTEFYTGAAWSAVGSSGGMTLLSTTTLSGTSTTISSISQSYTRLYGVMLNATFGGAATQFRCAPNADTGGSCIYIIGTSTTLTNSNLNYWFMCNSSIDSDNNAIAFEIENYTNTTKKPIRSWGGAVVGGNYVQQNATGLYQGSSALTSLVFTLTSGASFTGGTIKLYGVK